MNEFDPQLRAAHRALIAPAANRNAYRDRFPNVPDERSWPTREQDDALLAVDPAFPEDVPVEPVYHAAHSARLNAWYIANQSGECVSGLYESASAAGDALIEGAF